MASDGVPDDEQTLSDSDQWLSDRDQTASDTDQALSDRNQRASDDDQEASDRDFAEGEESAASHAKSAAARERTSRERDELGGSRYDTATQRDEAGRRRDELAARRDRAADLADQRAVEAETSIGELGGRSQRLHELRARELESRKIAAIDRERAARNRAQAAADRALAARDRELAAHEREQAGTDELTGARRRGIGLEELAHEIDRARRTGQALVAAYVDVDGLKQINDRHGHGAGDEVLRAVVVGMREQMRSYDLLMRLGGDEFLCVLLGVTIDEARERFRGLSSQLPGPEARSVSIGFTELRGDDGPAELIERADRDLMAARGIS